MRTAAALLIINIILCHPAHSRAAEAEEALYMSLHEALSLAVVNNFDVQLNLYDRYIKDTDVDLASSVFDTELTVTGDYEYNKSKPPTPLFGQTTHTGTAGATLTKKLITGTGISLGFNNQRISTDSAFAFLNPYYESTVEMKFTQPLLKNFFGMNDWGGVRITKIDVYNFNLETLDRIETDLAGVEKAYWEAKTAAGLVEAAKAMLERAEEFYEINKKKKRLGTSEITDLLAAEANMETRKTELAIEVDKYKTAVNKLKLLINHPATGADILPRDDIEFKAKREDFLENLKLAIANRRDYERARKDVKAKNLNLNLKRNARWPELDFEGSLTLNGLDGVYKSAAATAFTEENPVYKATLTFTLPFEDGRGRSEYDAARYEKLKALLTLKKVEKTIVTEIDDATRKLNLSRDTAENRLKIEALQKKKLEEEMRQFGIGRSDSDRIVRFQEDFLRARKLALNALKDYKEALVDLYLAQNVYLDERGLTLR